MARIHLSLDHPRWRSTQKGKFGSWELMAGFPTKPNPAYFNMPEPMLPQRFEQFFANYTGADHQKKAVSLLHGEILAANPGILSEDAAWRKAYSTPPTPPVANPLAVPYFWQLDNGDTGWRECQTSSLAMGLAYKHVPGIRDDLDYLRVVKRNGDTTTRGAHMGALEEIGYSGAEWRVNWTPEQIRSELDRGNVVAAGVLHHGHVSAPGGGGHFIAIIGYTNTHWICHDPYGEINLVNGGWITSAQGAGRSIEYSFQNLNPRLFVGGGWAWAIR